MMVLNWLRMPQQRAELSWKRSHFSLKSAILWSEQENTSWFWLRSGKKASFVCVGNSDQHTLSSSDPTGYGSCAEPFKTTLRPPNIWNLKAPFISHAGSHICKHHSCLTCSYHGLHYNYLNRWGITEHLKSFDQDKIVTVGGKKA